MPKSGAGAGGSGAGAAGAGAGACAEAGAGTEPAASPEPEAVTLLSPTHLPRSLDARPIPIEWAPRSHFQMRLYLAKLVRPSEMPIYLGPDGRGIHYPGRRWFRTGVAGQVAGADPATTPSRGPFPGHNSNLFWRFPNSLYFRKGVWGFAIGLMLKT